MAKFTNIVPGRLWQVRDLLPSDQVEEIQTTDWMNLPWSKDPLQEKWPRRAISYESPVAQRLSGYINSQLNSVNQALGTNFTKSGGQFWVDQPGFTVLMHTDGHLANALQMYWIAADETYGTGFYNFKNKNSLLYQFLSRPNTGYIMLNHLDDDGGQPLQWHAMFNPVPAGTVRVSSYWQFST